MVERSKDPWGYEVRYSSLTVLADTVNEAFLEPMSTFMPLGPVSTADARYSSPPSVSEYRVLKKLSVLNPAKSSGPDMKPFWLSEENEDLLAPAVTDIINCSFGEARLPQSWKHADIVPIPKQMPVYDVNKHLQPISLTPVLSKVAEEFVVEQHVKPWKKWIQGCLALSQGQALQRHLSE